MQYVIYIVKKMFYNGNEKRFIERLRYEDRIGRLRKFSCRFVCGNF